MARRLFNDRHAWTALAASSLVGLRELDGSSGTLSRLELTRAGATIWYDPRTADWWDPRDPDYVQNGFFRACRYLNLPSEPAIAATVQDGR
jgi:hypothetical protein